MTNPIFCWEQKVFVFVNAPFSLLATLVYFVLSPIYGLMQILVLPLLLLLLIMSVAWWPLAAIIMALSKLSRAVPVVRPMAFALALPFLLLAHFFVSISPVPTPNDIESKMLKWKFVELFPYCDFAQYGSED